MLRTITIGSTLQVQGIPVGSTPDGRLMVRDGDRIYTGHPVPRWTDHGTRVQQVLARARDSHNLDAS
jgi:hypothetical protein